MDTWQNVVKMSVSLALGTAIGFEREASDKAAGLRTNILICLGATLYTILSLAFTQDPARISAQIVSGIGFLGAGAIMRDGDRVTGLTTAATIWMVAAIGTAVGYGHYGLGTLCTAGVLMVQMVFTQFDILIDKLRERHTYKIVSKYDDTCVDEIAGLFRASRIHVMRFKVMKKNGFYYSEWYTAGPHVNNAKVMKQLLAAKDIMEVTY